MNEAKEDLLLHPVRLRIILATAGRQVTTQQLAYVSGGAAGSCIERASPTEEKE